MRALILAGAVSGMHWTAATGTSYTPIPNSANYPSGRWTVVVVAVIVMTPFQGGSDESHSCLACSCYGLRFKRVGWRENEGIELRKWSLLAPLSTQMGKSC